jgi:hypothetical protein
MRTRKRFVSERPANTLCGAQAGEQISLWLAGKQIGKVREAIPDRGQRGQPVVLAAQMRARSKSQFSALSP